MFACSLLWAIAVRQGPTPPVYFVRADSIYESAQGKETLIVKHAISPAVSADQKSLAFIRDGNLYTFNLARQKATRCSDLTENSAVSLDHDLYPSWDNQSKYVIFSHADRYGLTHRGEEVSPMFGVEHSSKSIWNVYWYWLSKGAAKSGLSLFLGQSTSGPSSFSVQSSLAAAFSPDGRRVAFCRNGDLWMATLDPQSVHDGIHEASWDEARILATATLEGGTRGASETTAIFRISWSPDGKLLAISSDRYSGQGNAEILVIKSDRPAEKVSAFPGSDACFLDGSHVLYVKPLSHSHDIWNRDLGTSEEKVLISHGTDPAVSSRG